LERLEYDAYQELGDVAEEWDSGNWRKPEQLTELSDKLTVVVATWLKKYGYEPNFNRIVNICKVELKERSNKMDGKFDHELKTLPRYFEEILCGNKHFEYRYNDRNFEVGDLIKLREWYPGKGYTGHEYFVSIKYILKDCPEIGLPDGYCIFSW
jgi:hypothetical protein